MTEILSENEIEFRTRKKSSKVDTRSPVTKYGENIEKIIPKFTSDCDIIFKIKVIGEGSWSVDWLEIESDIRHIYIDFIKKIENSYELTRQKISNEDDIKTLNLYRLNLTNYVKYLYDIYQNICVFNIENKTHFEIGDENLNLLVGTLDRYVRKYGKDGFAKFANLAITATFAKYSSNSVQQKTEAEPKEDSEHDLSHSEYSGRFAEPELIEAPELWRNGRQIVNDAETGQDRRENAAEFTLRVYGSWMGKGMTRNLLRKLDNPLFQALYRTYGANLPDDLPLPTKKEENDRWLARVEREGLAAVIPEGSSSDFVLREAQRILSAKRRREHD